MDKLSSTHAINVRNLGIYFSKFSKSLSFLLLHAIRLPQIKSVKCGRYFREYMLGDLSVYGVTKMTQTREGLTADRK